ncbi:hypothetical protein CASFOL_015739 [Castilleja foliolosa]|uniref:FAF domain-containing protein n=1 Tax=Castilleja foliolosa TaxID=1961234 RepID=A0ABD3DGM9_9LAMI
MHSSELAEFIGVESCFILESHVADFEYTAAPRSCHRRPRMAVTEKEYPRPIEWSLVMRKYCTSDDRVVLKQEKVMSHQYLLAHRSDGRLVMNLEVEEFDEDMDGGEDDDVETAVEEKEEEDGVGSCCNIIMYNEGDVNPTCGGFAPVAVFGPLILT